MATMMTLPLKLLFATNSLRHSPPRFKRLHRDVRRVRCVILSVITENASRTPRLPTTNRLKNSTRLLAIDFYDQSSKEILVSHRAAGIVHRALFSYQKKSKKEKKKESPQFEAYYLFLILYMDVYTRESQKQRELFPFGKRCF